MKKICSNGLLTGLNFHGGSKGEIALLNEVSISFEKFLNGCEGSGNTNYEY